MKYNVIHGHIVTVVRGESTNNHLGGSTVDLTEEEASANASKITPYVEPESVHDTE